MSKTRVTQWEAWRWCEALGDYERVTQSPIGEPILQPVEARVRLWHEDEPELEFDVWDRQSEADAASALQVHGLIECEREQSNDPYLNRITVLVRDWWTKQPLQTGNYAGRTRFGGVAWRTQSTSASCARVRAKRTR